jgi:hypothetical protein
MRDWTTGAGLKIDVETGAKCLDGSEGHRGAVRYGKGSTPDAHVYRLLAEPCKRFREAACLAEARGEEKYGHHRENDKAEL